MLCGMQLLRGIYAVFLVSWVGYFGIEPLLAIHAESYYAEPEQALRKASAHIGLPQPNDESVSPWCMLTVLICRDRLVPVVNPLSSIQKVGNVAFRS